MYNILWWYTLKWCLKSAENDLIMKDSLMDKKYTNQMEKKVCNLGLTN